MAFEYLGKKGHIGSLKTKNRLVMTAMGVGVGAHSGTATDEFIEFYTQRARGGAGLIITEITRVNETHGVGEYSQLSLAKDEVIPSFQKLADSVHQYGTKIFAQLHHPGRETHLVLNPSVQELVSSSPFPSVIAPEPTRALTVEEIHGLVNDFVSAAKRAQKAGLDGIEVHAGHGYLITQFLSANDNFRTDEYGGSLENRMRFLLEIIGAIREACGKDFPISVRLSSSEFLDAVGIKSGITVEESAKTAAACERAGADLINVSSGTHFTGNTIVEPTTYQQGWKLPLAAEIKKAVSIPVSATSVFREPEFCEKVLEEGSIDFIAMGRSWLADPEWGVKALNGRSDEIRKCLGCMYCFESTGNALCTGEGHVQCSVNPYLGEETHYDAPKQDGGGRKAVVVGSGPAGLEAVMILAERKFDVTLFEKEKYLGGQMHLSSLPPQRGKMGNFIKYAERQMKKLGVTVKLDTEVTSDEIKALNPYTVMLCTGSTAVLPKSIPGINGGQVYTAQDVLTEKVQFENKKIVVAGGGLTGMETAEFLQEKGNEVTDIDMLPAMGLAAFPLVAMDETSRLAKSGVRTMPGHKLAEIRENSVLLEDTAGYQIEIPCDAVVMCLGVRPVNQLKEELEGLENVYLLGDAEHSGRRVTDAVHAAFDAAYHLK